MVSARKRGFQGVHFNAILRLAGTYPTVAVVGANWSRTVQGHGRGAVSAWLWAGLRSRPIHVVSMSVVVD
jgi:hypothetical protein